MEPKRTLSFGDETFAEDDLDVDTWIAEAHRVRGISLEQLRDELQLHVRTLNARVVELVNNDYADFVNLSAHLVAIDKRLQAFGAPFENLSSQITTLLSSLESNHRELVTERERRERLFNQRNQLERIREQILRIRDIELILNSGSLESDGLLFERVALQLDRILALNELASHHPASATINARTNFLVDELCTRLEPQLKRQLISSQSASKLAATSGGDGVSDTRNTLSLILNTYILLRRSATVELLYRQLLVRPALLEVSNEHFIEKNGLDAVFSKFFECCNQFLIWKINLESSPYGEQLFAHVDIAVNSLWLELVQQLEQNATSLFGVGDPNAFHRVFACTQRSISRFERFLVASYSARTNPNARTPDTLPLSLELSADPPPVGELSDDARDALRRFRTHPQHIEFVNKWNLFVYFQMRFQEVGGQFEKSLTQSLDETPFEEAIAPGFVCSRLLLDSILKCWREDVYLEQLAHKFWKLTLQLLTRYGTWLASQRHLPLSSGATQQTASSDASSVGSAGESADSTAESKGSSALEVPLTSEERAQLSAWTLNRVALIGDLTFLVHSIPLLFQWKIYHRLSAIAVAKSSPGNIRVDSKSQARDETNETLSECEQSLVEAVQQALESHTDQLRAALVEQAAALCSRPSLRCVLDVPRLYRKTNRPAPTRASQYMSDLLGALEQVAADCSRTMLRIASARLCDALYDLTSEQQQALRETLTQELSRRSKRILLEICASLLENLLNSVCEVLQSVKKMEDTLRRLKRLPTSRRAEKADAGTGSLSDDDKIRLQLLLDLQAFAGALDSFELGGELRTRQFDVSSSAGAAPAAAGAGDSAPVSLDSLVQSLETALASALPPK